MITQGPVVTFGPIRVHGIQTEPRPKRADGSRFSRPGQMGSGERGTLGLQPGDNAAAQRRIGDGQQNRQIRKPCHALIRRQHRHIQLSMLKAVCDIVDQCPNANPALPVLFKPEQDHQTMAARPENRDLVECLSGLQGCPRLIRRPLEQPGQSGQHPRR